MPKCPLCPRVVAELTSDRCVQCDGSLQSCGTHLLPVCPACEQFDHQLTTCVNAVWPVTGAFSSIYPCAAPTQSAEGEVGSHPDLLTRISDLERVYLEEERARLRRALDGARFEVNPIARSKLARQIKKRASKVTKTAANMVAEASRPVAEAVDQATEQVREALARLVPQWFDATLPELEATFPEIFSDVIPAALEAVAAAVAQAAPLAGTGVSATRLFLSAYDTVSESTDALASHMHAAHFAAGPPHRAATSVERSQTRKARGAAIGTGVGALGFAGQAPADAAAIVSIVTTPFSFGGTAAFLIPTTLAGVMTAFGKSLVSFLYTLHVMARDYREVRAANRILRDGGPLDEQIFEVCPLLGAAYLVETSTEQTTHLVRLPRTVVDSICAGDPEASGRLAAAAAAAKRVLFRPKSFREQVSNDLREHVDPTIARARKQLTSYGWVLRGPNITVAHTLPADTPAKLLKRKSKAKPASTSGKPAGSP